MQTIEYINIYNIIIIIKMSNKMRDIIKLDLLCQVAKKVWKKVHCKLFAVQLTMWILTIITHLHFSE